MVNKTGSKESGSVRKIEPMVFNVLPEYLSHRDTKTYRITLGLSTKDLVGKKVLDIGAGYGAAVDEYAGLGIDITGLDPQYANLALRNASGLATPKSNSNKVAGINETLPFADNSFDLVLCGWSSLYYLSDNYPDRSSARDAAKIMFNEMFRVLKVGGQARIGSECWVDEDERDFILSIVDEVVKNNKGVSWNLSKAGEELEVLVLNHSE